MMMLCPGLLALVPRGAPCSAALSRARACRSVSPLLLEDSAAQWYADRYAHQARESGTSVGWQGGEMWSAEMGGPAELAGMPWSPPASMKLPFDVDTQPAAAEVAALVEADMAARMRQCELEMADSEGYIERREALVGLIDSSELLRLDAQHSLWPLELGEADGAHPTSQSALAPDASGGGAEAASMLWVDEITCVGCKFCSSVARGTFMMTTQMSGVDAAHDYGTARVVQQGADHPSVVAEAIATCPADCIHHCTLPELELLETHRALYMNELLARFSGCGSLTGDSGGSLAAPHWRDPLVHTGWRNGDAYVKTARLRMVNPMVRDRQFYDPSKAARQPDGVATGDEDEGGED